MNMCILSHRRTFSVHAYAYVKREFTQLPAIDEYKYTNSLLLTENGRERMSEEKTYSNRRINKRK